MAKRPKFTFSFAPEAIEHLDLIESKYHGLLRRTINEQLTHTPTEENSEPEAFGPAGPVRGILGASLRS